MARVYHNRRKTAWTDYVIEDPAPCTTLDFGSAFDTQGSGDEKLPYSRQPSAQTLDSQTTAADSLDGRCSLSSGCIDCPSCDSHLLRCLKSKVSPDRCCVCDAVDSEYEISGRCLNEVLAEADERGWSPMLIAARRGQTEAVHALIELGAQADCEEASSGWTPLMYAASLGHAEIVKALIAAGVNVNKLASKSGWNALCAAHLAGNDDIASVLVSHGANVKAACRCCPELAERYATCYKC